MILNFFSKTKCLGLDIGSKNIKLVNLVSSKGKKYKLVDFKILPLKIKEKLDFDTKQEVILQTIKNLFAENPSLPKKVAISVSGPSVVIRYIKLPIMSKEELEKSISIEAESFIPFPITDVYLSFDVIGEVIDENVKKNEVVVVAVRKELIDYRIKLLKECKLTPLCIDVDIFVLEKVINYNYNVKDDVVCVINIGGEMTNIGIIEKGVTRVSRDLPIGLDSIISEIKKAQQIEEDVILKCLKSEGLIVDEEKRELYIQEQKKFELLFSKNLMLALKELISEIHKIIDFYYFQEGEQKPLSKIFLSGGGSIIKNLDLHFYNEFKVEVEYLDPFKNIENSEGIPFEERAILPVATGLAIRGLSYG